MSPNPSTAVIGLTSETAIFFKMKSTFKSQNCHYAGSEPQQLYIVISFQYKPHLKSQESQPYYS